MSAQALKPDIREKLAAALNSSDLSPSGDRERPIDLITALGYSQVNPDATEHQELEWACVDPRTELGALLMRLKYGGDRTAGGRALQLLVVWVQHQRTYRKWRIRFVGEKERLQKFARLALAEWLFPTCPVCSGREYLGLDAGSVRSRRVQCKRCKGKGEVQHTPTAAALAEYGVRPVQVQCDGCGGFGSYTHQKPVRGKPRPCYSCKGTGVRRDSDIERARELGVDVKVYERLWAKRFSWLAGALDRLDHTEKRCLQAQMEHGIKRL